MRNSASQALSCTGKTLLLPGNIRIQTNSQGVITAIGVPLTGPLGYQSGGSGAYISIPSNTIIGIALGNGGALSVGLSNPLYFSPKGPGAPLGAYITSATYNNGSFSQVTGAVSFEGLPFGSRYTQSNYLTKQFNQNSALANIAGDIQSAAKLAQSLVGCSANGG